MGFSSLVVLDALGEVHANSIASLHISETQKVRFPHRNVSRKS